MISNEIIRRETIAKERRILKSGEIKERNKPASNLCCTIYFNKLFEHHNYFS